MVKRGGKTLFLRGWKFSTFFKFIFGVGLGLVRRWTRKSRFLHSAAHKGVSGFGRNDGSAWNGRKDNSRSLRDDNKKSGSKSKSNRKCEGGVLPLRELWARMPKF
jgi:hypothetical protein